jgi:hypothetical protein
MPYRLVVDAPEHYRTSVISIVGETDLADVAPVSEPVSVNPVYLLVAALGVTVAPLVDGLVPAVHLPPASGGLQTTRYDQIMAAAVWLIDHNLGRYPAAVVLFAPDLSEQYSEYKIQHLSLDSLRVSMDIPTAGVALLI